MKAISDTLALIAAALLLIAAALLGLIPVGLVFTPRCKTCGGTVISVHKSCCPEIHRIPRLR